MMYNDKLVVAVKVGGRVLREQGDMVSLPFGSEYSLLIKNLNSVRSQVSVSVDGQDATDGTRLIIAPNSSVELERFIKNGNLKAGNKFKFIERTDDVEAHRGVRVDDGLIRVEAWREHVLQFIPRPIPYYYDDPIPVPRPYYPLWRPHPCRYTWTSNATNGPQMRRGPQASSGNRQRASNMAQANFVGNVQATGASASAPTPDMAGITVPGSQSNQQFHSAQGFMLEPQSAVIVLRLRGLVGDVPIAAPITVDFKPTCQTCGKSGDANSQFCACCGTSLQLV